MVKRSAFLKRVTHFPIPLLTLITIVPIILFLSDSQPSHYDSVTTGTRADWDTLPEYCHTMLANPQPFHKFCNRNRTTMVCDSTSGEFAGKTLLFSQIAQDYYVWEWHFKHLKRRGVYAEVATKDPFWGSNTMFMDRCLNWKGVCVEANPRFIPYIHRERGCEVVPTCVSDRDGEMMKFLMMDDAGGLAETNKNVETYKGKVEEIMTVCMSMEVLMKRRAIQTLDFLSLDVEGHELKVLKGFDWERTKVNVMTIETTKESLVQIQEFLESIGYKRHIPLLDEHSIRTGLLRWDAMFLHKDVVWGQPV